MWIKKLEVQNFQSHKHTSVEFVPDFNCIIGTSRVGKTSLIRALEFLLFDEWHDSFVRKGADFTSVIAYFDNGFVLERKKGPALNEIVLTYPNGKKEVFEKFGTNMPPEVRNVLKIFPTKIDVDYEINLNLADQDSLPFLLSESSLTKTKFLNRLTGSHIIDAALRSLNKDKLELLSEKQRCQEDLSQLQQKLENFKNIDKISGSVKKLEKRFYEVEEKLLLYAKLKQISEKLAEISIKEQKIENFLNWFNQVYTKISELQKRYDLYLQLVKLQSLIEKLNNVENQLVELKSKGNQLITQFKHCPFCGSELKKGQILKWLN